ncbi:metabolite traffic protein EboE [Streptomyces sp. SID10853]|uniref:metabolite traffic protein EboE n=1 Tax=Streptomyces sp. SID10853 TaxID=2706028 RepID=UPI0013C197C1|nr:metabolite traffic protein EboE [Streptomyces sp. SID10853]
MRFRHRDGSVVHLAYCTNVHAAETLDGVTDQLDRYAARVRDRLDVPVLGVGLWLARDAARELASRPDLTARLRDHLRRRGLETVTLNAFPYRGFHRPVVKHAVYTPDWSDPRRLAYTVDCARVLAGLLPHDITEGSISTLPLGWRTDWTPQRHATARAHLVRLAAELSDLRRNTGRTVRVGLEPEPGCAVETTAQAARLLAGLPGELGVCLDTCHLAVQFEEPAAALARLHGASLDVVKAQISRALHVADPAAPGRAEHLAGYAEPRFLHQTRMCAADGTVHSTDDLTDALQGPLPRTGPWRVHFHTPLHADPEPPLQATGDVLESALQVLLGGPRAHVRHLETETYTWAVLPAAARPRDRDDLVAGIAAELDWTRNALLRIGLAEDSAPARPGPADGPGAARTEVTVP